MPKSVAELSREYKARMKSKGFVQLSVFVLKKNVARIKAIEAADKLASKGE